MIHTTKRGQFWPGVDTLHSWLVAGRLQARRVPDGPWIITADQAEQARLRELHARPNGYYTRRRYLDNLPAGSPQPATTPKEGDDHDPRPTA